MAGVISISDPPRSQWLRSNLNSGTAIGYFLSIALVQLKVSELGAGVLFRRHMANSPCGLVVPTVKLKDKSEMDVFDFLTQDELDDTPEDASSAFLQLVRHAQRRLTEQIKSLHHEDYEGVDEARHGFMNVVLALGKAYKIEPFASMDVPRYSEFNKEVHRQFRADLDHYVTQLLVDNTARAKRDSILVPSETKDRIRVYIHALKEAIDHAKVSEAKKAALRAKLGEFEAELEKRRLSVLSVAKFTLAIFAVPGTVWASYEIVTKLTNNVLEAVGEAKVVDDESRNLPPIGMPSILLAPRRSEKEVGPMPSKRTPPSRGDLDDEIPF